MDRNCRIKRVEVKEQMLWRVLCMLLTWKNHVENSVMRVIHFEFVVGSGKTYLLAIRFLACLFIIFVSLKNNMRPIGWSQPPQSARMVGENLQSRHFKIWRCHTTWRWCFERTRRNHFYLILPDSLKDMKNEINVVLHYEEWFKINSPYLRYFYHAKRSYSTYFDNAKTLASVAK